VSGQHQPNSEMRTTEKKKHLNARLRKELICGLIGFGSLCDFSFKAKTIILLRVCGCAGAIKATLTIL